jgi:hypothetical protein
MDVIEMPEPTPKRKTKKTYKKPPACRWRSGSRSMMVGGIMQRRYLGVILSGASIVHCECIAS